MTDPIETAHAGLVALFGMCFLLAGLTLPRVLKSGSAGWIPKMLVASIVFVAARTLLGFVLFRTPLALAGGPG